MSEASIAVDPFHEVIPVKMMQALQAIIEALQAHAAKIVKHEKGAKVQDKDGALQPVADGGGRQCLQSLAWDVVRSGFL